MQNMNIRTETGCFHSFCPLASIGWLHRKIKNSFHLILGTGTCASFIQNAFGMMIFSRPRFATAVMDESDIHRGPSFKDLQEISQKITSDFHVEVLFLWGTCTSEILKIDMKRWCKELERKFRIRVIPVPVSGLEVSFTDGEDMLLSSLTETAAGLPDEDNLVLIGSLSDPVETELSLALEKLGIPVRYFPSGSIAGLPYLGQRSSVVFVQPYLSRTFEKLKQLGCRIIKAPMPFGARATRTFYEVIFSHFGKKADYRQREKKIHALNASLEAKIHGKSFFFFPDTNLEIPLARFLLETGAQVLETGTPSLDEEMLSCELDTLRGFHSPLFLRPDYHEQMERLERLKPDLVISPLALSNYLIEKGYTVKLSMDFLMLPLHGFSNHRALLELLVHALES